MIAPKIYLTNFSSPSMGASVRIEAALLVSGS